VASNRINITSISRPDQLLVSRTSISVITDRGFRVPKHGDKKKGGPPPSLAPETLPTKERNVILL
jgi:hypothetical protein